MPDLTIISKRERLTGFRYFWFKSVVGFDPRHHCAKCLKGGYLDFVSKDMPTKQRFPFFAEPGSVLYLCGVSAPYRWADNLHLAVRVKPGARAAVRAHTGDTVYLTDCEEIEFDEAAARRRFSGLGREFLTCRNFQFGAHHFSE